MDPGPGCGRWYTGPRSGVSLYFPKATANDGGYTDDGGPIAGLYPAIPLQRGQVVALTNMLWDPYVPSTDVDGLPQDQFEFQPTSILTVVGPGTLPPPVPLAGYQIMDAGAMYMGMRVVQTTTPDLVVNACPAALFSE